MWMWYLEQLEQLEQLERYAPLGSLLLSEAIGEAARHLRELVGSPSAETRRRWDSPFSSRVGFMVSCFIKVVQTCAGWAYGKQNR